MEKSKIAKAADRKLAYVKPALVRLGKFLELTQTKAGTKADGAGKPATRATGVNA